MEKEKLFFQAYDHHLSHFPSTHFEDVKEGLNLVSELALPPSQNTTVKWLTAFNRTNRNNMQPVTLGALKMSGNWLIFKPPEEVDEAWRIVKAATEAGDLGYMSSVRTRKCDELEGGNLYIICVSTYNVVDYNDVRRVRAALRELGFRGNDKLQYSTHVAAHKANFSKYFHHHPCVENGCYYHD